MVSRILRSFVAVVLLLGSATTRCHGWVSRSPSSSQLVLMSSARESSRLLSPLVMLFMADEAEEEEENPCWQEFYDDDCAMATAEAATFVASKWIKSMPCAEGIEDCDMPEDLQAPGTRKEAGIDHVDVMGFLGLKRAERVGKDTREETA